MSDFCLSILTPTTTILKDFVVDSVIVPTMAGQITLLEKHVQLLTTLDIAPESQVLTINVGKKKLLYTLIGGGVCKIANDKITILTKESVLLSQDSN